MTKPRANRCPDPLHSAKGTKRTPELPPAPTMGDSTALVPIEALDLCALVLSVASLPMPEPTLLTMVGSMKPNGWPGGDPVAPRRKVVLPSDLAAVALMEDLAAIALTVDLAAIASMVGSPLASFALVAAIAGLATEKEEVGGLVFAGGRAPCLPFQLPDQALKPLPLPMGLPRPPPL